MGDVALGVGIQAALERGLGRSNGRLLDCAASRRTAGSSVSVSGAKFSGFSRGG